MATTPLMNLTLPDPTVTPGPEWATILNEAMDVIDAHDHSSGKGSKITPSGLNVNEQIPMNDNDLIDARSLRMSDQPSAIGDPADLRALYAVGGELYYNDGIGNQIQLTTGGGLNAASVGGFGGDYGVSTALASYNSVSSTFLFEQTAGVNALIDAADITIREAVASANGIKLKSPSALAASYDITLPAALPGSKLPVQMDASGILTVEQIATAQITDNAVTTSKINDLAVTEPKLADNAVTENKIANLSVTSGKLGADVNSTISDIESDVANLQSLKFATTRFKNNFNPASSSETVIFTLSSVVVPAGGRVLLTLSPYSTASDFGTTDFGDGNSGSYTLYCSAPSTMRLKRTGTASGTLISHSRTLDGPFIENSMTYNDSPGGAGTYNYQITYEVPGGSGVINCSMTLTALVIP